MNADIPNGIMTPAVISISMTFPKGPVTKGIKEVSVRNTKRPVITPPVNLKDGGVLQFAYVVGSPVRHVWRSVNLSLDFIGKAQTNTAKL
jgi:hypothetical protein